MTILTALAAIGGIGFLAWERHKVVRDGGPEFRSLPAEVGTHRMEIHPVGDAPGYHIRLLDSRNQPWSAKDTRALQWRVVGFEEGIHLPAAEKEYILDVWTRKRPLVLEYDVTPELSDRLRASRRGRIGRGFWLLCSTGTSRPRP